MKFNVFIAAQADRVRGFSRTQKYLAIVSAILIVVAGGTYLLTQGTRGVPGDQQAKKEQTVQDVVAAVSKIFRLPEGEEPVMATITDPEKLRDQPFFVYATKGDRVLIYNTAKKAILYRPSEQRIIDVTALNINPPQQPTPEPSTKR